MNAGNAPMGRATTIPVHSKAIGAPLFYRILKQLEIDEARFAQL